MSKHELPTLDEAGIRNGAAMATYHATTVGLIAQVAQLSGELAVKKALIDRMSITIKNLEGRVEALLPKKSEPFVAATEDAQ